jgi:hypothetical protein
MKVKIFLSILLSGVLPILSAAQPDVEDAQVTQNLLYLDSSGSMKGYLGASSDSRFIGTLAAFMYSAPTEVRLFGTKEGNALSSSQFEKQLNTKNIQWSAESDLTKMISSLTQRISSGYASYGILITDGIMSGSNSEIQREPNYNKTRRGLLTQKILNVFNTYKANPENKQLSAIVIQYTSSFTGKYYKYNNAYVNLNNKERPYYAIIFVESRDCAAYLQNLEQNDALKSYANIYVIGEPNPEIKILPYKNTASHIPGGLQLNSAAIKNNGGNLAITVPTGGLPNYMRDAEFIQKNIELIKVTDTGEQVVSSERYALEVASNRLVLSISPNYIRGSKIKVRIKNSLPAWVEGASSDDDSQIDHDEMELNRTFNFKYLMDGFKPLHVYTDIITPEILIR